MTSWSSSARRCAISMADSPVIQSSTYTSLWMIWWTSGYSSLKMSAIDRSLHSAWFPPDLIPYISVLMTFSLGIFMGFRSCCQMYRWKHQSLECNLIVLYIFRMSVWIPIGWTDHLISTSCRRLRLFWPLAKRSFRLYPDDVGCDASNTTRHGVLTELAFQTARHGMKFWVGDLDSASCSSGERLST